MCLYFNIAQLLGRSGPTTRNIVQWGVRKVKSREIPERKEREDSDLWIYDGDLKNGMKEFVRR